MLDDFSCEAVEIIDELSDFIILIINGGGKEGSLWITLILDGTDNFFDFFNKSLCEI